MENSCYRKNTTVASGQTLALTPTGISFGVIRSGMEMNPAYFLYSGSSNCSDTIANLYKSGSDDSLIMDFIALGPTENW